MFSAIFDREEDHYVGGGRDDAVPFLAFWRLGGLDPGLGSYPQLSPQLEFKLIHLSVISFVVIATKV